MDDANLDEIIRSILKEGVTQDLKKGNQSCDEVLQNVDRYKSTLKRESLMYGKLKDPSVFDKFLDNLEEKGKSGERQCIILTKPPETIAVFHQPEDKDYKFLIFEFVQLLQLF